MHPFNPAPRRATLLILAGAAVATFAAGCSGSPHGGGSNSGAGPSASSDSATAGQFNNTDVEFAQDMIVHHRQAVEMADSAATQADSAEVNALAAKIKQAQGPEIDQMMTWLHDWGAPMPSRPAGGHRGHGQTPGMMTAKEMSALHAASGSAFDRIFLEMMIRHHEGALRMATTEQQRGQNPAAKALAAKIESDQTAEIQQMRTMLAMSKK